MNIVVKRETVWWEKVDTDIKKAVVQEIDVRTATNLIKRYEWLQCMPAMVQYCYGIYFEGNLGGAVVYSTEYTENLESSSNLVILDNEKLFYDKSIISTEVETIKNSPKIYTSEIIYPNIIKINLKNN